jgi:hypothetical protein
MKTYIVYPLYQTPAGPGTPANNIITAEGVAIRIEPIASLAGIGISFPGNRHVLLDSAAQVNVAFSGTGWITQTFKSFQFGVETTGTAASDAWMVWVAEKEDDPAKYGGVGIPFSSGYVYNATSGLYTSTSGTNAFSGQNVTVVNTLNINAQDVQLFDGTATASSALSSGTQTLPGFRDLLIRVSNLTAPTSRVLSILGVRSDSSTVGIYTAPAIGATITDVVLGAGQGANVPTIPIGATSVGLSFSCPLPTILQVNLSSGTDTPRMTIWARQSS